MTELDLPGDPWEYATWEGAERARLLAGSRLSLREKLDWLEEAAEWVQSLDRSGRPGSQREGEPRAVTSRRSAEPSE